MDVRIWHLHNMYTMLDQRRRHRTDVVQMLYKCFVFAGIYRRQILTHIEIRICRQKTVPALKKIQ